MSHSYGTKRSKRSMRGKINVLSKKEMALELLLLPFILLQSMLFSPCSLVRTKFPNRVMNAAATMPLGFMQKK
jgi:hypothetical protein